jgi:hypothetical protein
VSRLGFEEAVMIDKTGGIRIPRRAGALAVVAAAAVLAAGCATSTTSASSDPGQPTYAQELALAQCMRGHGVPNFPNPSASGGFSLNASTLDSSQTQTAYGACRHLLPNGGPNISQIAQEEQQKQAEQLPELLKFQQCVQSHGEPDFSLGLSGQSPPPGKSSGFNPNTPQFQAALNACQHLLPPGAHVSVNTSTSRS